MADKPIKIFVDAHCFDTCFQGTQTFIRELYRSLINRPNLDIYWGLHNADNLLQIFPEINTANILHYKKRGPGILRFVFDIPYYIKKHRFDYAHFQYLAPIKQQGCKYIITTHDLLFNDFKSDFPFFYRWSRNILFKWSLKNAAIKTTVSEYSKSRIIEHFKIAAEEIEVISNGVNTAFIAKEDAQIFIKEKYGIENFILYVSRIESRKNHCLLLEKYLKLRLYEKGMSLVFIGSETIPVKALNNIIGKLSLEQKSMFFHLPQVDQNDLDAFYAGCKLFVYPSKAEGFGIPPLEAAINKVPVLCSSVTAMRDFDFFEPYFFDPENEEDFEMKLKGVISNPPSEKHLQIVSQQILEKYQWQNSSKKFYHLLLTGQKKLIENRQLTGNQLETAYLNPQLHLKNTL